MNPRPPRSTRTYPLLPYTTLVRSRIGDDQHRRLAARRADADLRAPVEPRRGPGLQRPFLAVRMDDAGARQDIINTVLVDCVDADRGADVHRALSDFDAARSGRRIADPPRASHSVRPNRRGFPAPRPRFVDYHHRRDTGTQPLR